MEPDAYPEHMIVVLVLRPTIMMVWCVCTHQFIQKSNFNLIGSFCDSFYAHQHKSGSEDPVLFNGADAEGASWRGLVPVAVWPDREWFDADGNFLGISGGHDMGRTTVTR